MRWPELASVQGYGEEILLGLVQGLTEFLPVSSSGHLKALQIWLDSPLAEDLRFDVFVHFATLIAVFWVFRADFAMLLRGGFRPSRGTLEPEAEPDARQWLLYVIIGAIPAGIVGLLFGDAIESLPTHLPYTVPICWGVTGLGLLSLRRLDPKTFDRSLDLRLVLWIGCWQALALLPGISRSGTTIAAALWLRCRPDLAARFSFLCVTPLILGATALQVRKSWFGDAGVAGSTSIGYIIGGIVALVSGYFSLRLLLGMLSRGALHWWSYYLFTVAVLYSGWLFTR